MNVIRRCGANASKQALSFSTNAYLLVHLTLVDVDLLRGLLQRLLQQDHVLLVLLALQSDLLDGAFLFPQNFDCFGVTAFLLVQFHFHVANACLQLGDNATAANHSVGLDLLKANGKVLCGRAHTFVRYLFNLFAGFQSPCDSLP